MNIYSGLQAVLVVVLSTFCLHLGTQVLNEHTLFRVTHLERLISADWAQITASKPKLLEFSRQISQFEVEHPPQDKLAALWARHLQWPITISTRAKPGFKLEALILSDTDEGSLAVTVQYSVIDLSTGDLVAEISRRYPLSSSH